MFIVSGYNVPIKHSVSKFKITRQKSEPSGTYTVSKSCWLFRNALAKNTLILLQNYVTQ